MKFDQHLPFYTLLKGKINSQQKVNQKFEFLFRVEFGLIS
jgi:hypothetical protein